MHHHILGWSDRGEYDGWDIRKMKNGYKQLVRKAEDIDEEIILKLSLRKQDVMVWASVTWLRIVGSYELNNKLLHKRYTIS
jgi:hypothetical protein